MNRGCSVFISVILLATMTALASSVVAKDSADFVKTPVILKAKEVLPEKLLKGKNFIVEERVENDGFINTYQLTTNYGSLKAESMAELVIRIKELHAMDSMEEMDREKVFGDAVVSGVKAPFQGAYNLVTDPVNTGKGIIEGTGRFLSNVGRSLVSDDPHQDNALKVAVGYDAAKRQFAYELGINPYSDNEPAMSMLAGVAQAAVAGGLAPKMAMAAIGSGVGTAIGMVGTSEEIRKLVRDNPPGELEKINAAKLAEMGIPKSLADSFMRNYVFDPQEKTFLIGELERFKGVEGRERFIAAAELVSQKTVARFYRVMARMMAGYHTHVSPVERIDRVAGTPCLKKKDGTVVLAVPLDHVFWTAEVSGKLDRIEEDMAKSGDVSGKELWLAGSVDGGARQALAASGWKIMDNAYETLMK